MDQAPAIRRYKAMMNRIWHPGSFEKCSLAGHKCILPRAIRHAIIAKFGRPDSIACTNTVSCLEIITASHFLDFIWIPKWIHDPFLVYMASGHLLACRSTGPAASILEQTLLSLDVLGKISVTKQTRDLAIDWSVNSQMTVRRRST